MVEQLEGVESSMRATMAETQPTVGEMADDGRSDDLIARAASDPRIIAQVTRATHEPSMGTPPRTNTPPTQALDSAELESGRLYAVLTYRGDLASWNWAFFVPNPSVRPVGAAGTFFHVVSDTDSATHDKWRFEMEARDVLSSPLSVAIVGLADVGFLGGYEEVVGTDSLVPILRTVRVPPLDGEMEMSDRHGGGSSGQTGRGGPSEFSSRTWFLDAICVLHDCGVVNCYDVASLEKELKKCAFLAMDKYLGNEGWMVFRSKRCS